MDQMGDHMKINIEYFQIQKWISQTVRVEKNKRKKWGHLSSSYVSFQSYGP